MKRLIILGLVAALVIVMSAPAALFAAGGKKVTICHNGHTIKVSKKAWKNAHKPIHHDKKGPCNGNGNHHGNGNGGKDDDEDCDNNHNGITTASEVEYCDDDNGNGGNHDDDNGNGGNHDDDNGNHHGDDGEDRP